MRAGGIKIEPIDELILLKVLKGKSKQQRVREERKMIFLLSIQRKRMSVLVGNKR